MLTHVNTALFVSRHFVSSVVLSRSRCFPQFQKTWKNQLYGLEGGREIKFTNKYAISFFNFFIFGLNGSSLWQAGATV